jgi:hypothetical protein
MHIRESRRAKPKVKRRVAAAGHSSLVWACNRAHLQTTFVTFALQPPTLLLLPFLYGTVMLFLLSRAYDWLERSGLPTPATVAADIVLTAIALVGQVLTVVILTRAYRLGWPQAAPAQSDA